MRVWGWIAALCALATAASAEHGCVAYEPLAKELRDGGGERIVFSGLSVQGHVVEIWLNDATGKWHLVLRLANGLGCIEDFGLDFGIADPVGEEL